ncbi:hypothetical protein MASR2M15_05780 [Anaerolineales bacterium]
MRMKNLETKFLTLRPLALQDVDAIQNLAGRYEIASITMNIPYPYLSGMAVRWLSEVISLPPDSQQSFAICLKPSSELIGVIALHIDQKHERARISHWLSVDYWQTHFSAEAIKCLVAYGFHDLKLNRLYTQYFANDSYNARIYTDAGFITEGVLKQHVKKWGQFRDLCISGIVKNPH